MAKNNAFLAKIQAKHQRDMVEVRGQTREGLAQIYLMAMLFAAHECLQVGPDRAGKLLRTFIKIKEDLAVKLVNEVGDSWKGGNGDPEYLIFRRDKTIQLKRIFSPDDWEMYKELFPLLRRYWDIEK